jgi:HK97 family phage major capsid protein
MNRLEKLRAELDQKKAEGVAIIELAEAEDRDLTEAEQEDLDAIEDAIEELQGKIASAEELAERRRQIAPARSTEGQRSAAGQMRVNDPNPATSGGFKDIGEFAVAVHGAVQANRTGGVMDNRLRQMAVTGTHQGGGTAGEGFMLPPEFRDQVWELVQPFDEFGPLIDEEPTAARSVRMGADETTPWGASGITAYWRAEGSQMSPSKLDDQGREVFLHDLYTLALATEELLEDAPRLANRITNKAAEAIAWKKNLAIVEGSGVGQPLGWTQSAAQVTVAKESGQAAGTIVAANVAKMFSRLQRVPGDSPFWLINQDALPQLMVMTIGDRPIWSPPGGFADAPGGFLMGLPVRFSEFCETVGTKNDIQLISPRGYYGLRRASGVKFASSIHLYFDYAIEAFRWTFRYGGAPYLSAPIAPAKGGSTRSHFVTLATRA